jgi:hypothetical protein
MTIAQYESFPNNVNFGKTFPMIEVHARCEYWVRKTTNAHDDAYGEV